MSEPALAPPDLAVLKKIYLPDCTAPRGPQDSVGVASALQVRSSHSMPSLIMTFDGKFRPVQPGVEGPLMAASTCSPDKEATSMGGFCLCAAH